MRELQATSSTEIQASKKSMEVHQPVRVTYDEAVNVIIAVPWSASRTRGSEFLLKQAIVAWVQTDEPEQEFSVLKN